MIFLVRDPRGTMASRLGNVRSWCVGNDDCEDPQRLCNELEDQYYISKHLKKKVWIKFQVSSKTYNSLLFLKNKMHNHNSLLFI